MIFQPHRYTRTRDLYEDFVEVLCQVDALLILDVYSAGEDEIAGASSKNICGSIRQRGNVDPIYVPSLEAVPDLIAGLVRPGDIVLTQGAGSVTQLVALLTETELGQKKT
jgi:UDP-N-acetylmuramate--alanine ligase